MTAAPWWEKIAGHERKIYSQLGEEGILEYIFDNVSVANRYAVEIGAGDGKQLSNTRHLREIGWEGLMLDCAFETAWVRHAFVTAENVNDLLDENGAPEEPDLVSIDIDGMDYWIWKAMRRKPRVIVIEFNGEIPIEKSIVVPYDPAFKHDGTSYYGASFSAMRKLGVEKGYTLVHQHWSVNLFFVRSDLLPERVEIEVPFAPQRYHPDHHPARKRRGHRAESSPSSWDRPWVQI